MSDEKKITIETFGELDLLDRFALAALSTALTNQTPGKSPEEQFEENCRTAWGIALKMINLRREILARVVSDALANKLRGMSKVSDFLDKIQPD